MRFISLAKLKAIDRRKWLKIGIAILIVHALISASLFVAMKQPPQKFAGIMAKLPMVSMLVFPFETMWNVARAGQLKVGELAPDFNLKAYESSSWIRLSSFRGDRPVVLIFGSYT